MAIATTPEEWVDNLFATIHAGEPTTAADRGAIEHAKRQPTETLIAQVENARQELAHIAALEERRPTWTEAERDEARYSAQRSVNTYRKLNAAQDALRARGAL